MKEFIYWLIRLAFAIIIPIEQLIKWVKKYRFPLIIKLIILFFSMSMVYLVVKYKQ